VKHAKDKMWEALAWLLHTHSQFYAHWATLDHMGKHLCC